MGGVFVPGCTARFCASCDNFEVGRERVSPGGDDIGPAGVPELVEGPSGIGAEGRFTAAGGEGDKASSSSIFKAVSRALRTWDDIDELPVAVDSVTDDSVSNDRSD